MHSCTLKTEKDVDGGNERLNERSVVIVKSLKSSYIWCDDGCSFVLVSVMKLLTHESLGGEAEAEAEGCDKLSGTVLYVDASYDSEWP